jgi:glutamate-1-semialdehyde 2,1-aminomutase
MKQTTSPAGTGTIDRQKLTELLQEEVKIYEKSHPRSKTMFETARAHLVGGLLMPWMARWGTFPLLVA